MNYIYDYFNNLSKITIYSAKPEDLNSSQDILAILLYEYPTLNPNFIIVSNPHDNLAIIVGDNINIKGMIKVHIEKNKNAKGVTNNAKSCWEYTIK